MTKPRVLRQVPGETDQIAGQHQNPPQRRALRLEARLSQALRIGDAIRPAAAALGQRIDLLGRQPEHPRHIAHRASRVIGTDHGGQCRTVATIAAEHILNDLFAAIVLEIHIDIGRLVALA